MDYERLAEAAASRKSRGGQKGFVAVLAISAIVMSVFASSAVALSPAVGTKAATNVDYSTVTLNGAINSNGLATKVYFEYGPTVAYGSKTGEVSVGSGSSGLETAQAISGLTPNTTYHYRVAATNADGTSSGADRTFTVGWSVQTPAANSPTSVFEGVSCSGAGACTAVGTFGGQAVAQRWNGSEWKAQTLVKPEGASEYALLGVSCPSASACTAVGRYKDASAKWVSLVEFWNGSEWKIQSSPNPTSAGAELDNVSCLSASECTAVGYYWTSGPETQQTLALRWNGSEWKIQTTTNPSSHAYLRSISCTSSTFCMGTGFYNVEAGTYAPFSEVWNGSEWVTKSAVKPSGATMSWFFGVSCTSSTACTGIGQKEVSAQTHEYQTMAQRWNGSEWSLQTTPNPEGSNRYMEDVSCTSSTSCTALGYLGESGGPFTLRWNGSAWTTQLLPNPPGSTKVIPHGISCIASRGCEMVGQYSVGINEVVLLAEGSWRAAMPTVSTAAATSVGEKTATVNGTANPNGSETKAYFEYGTTTSYGSKTAEVNVGSGTSAVEAGQALTGLNPATTYHYRIVASNENPETSRGADQTFHTTGPPTVTTLPAEVDATTGEAATLRGQVNPNGLSTTYQFEYGTSPGSYTSSTPVESAGSGTEANIVSSKVTGLVRGKTYYFRITASNSAGKANGNESSFTTPDLPGAETAGPAGITYKCATLQGVVSPHGLSTKYWFDYGLTTKYGSKIPLTAKEVSGGTAFKFVEERLCGLSGNTLYHHRLVAQNALGTTIGKDVTFTTLPAVTLGVGGVALKAGAPLKAAGGPLTFKSNTGKVHTCQEGELSGAVTENPGALQSISTLKMQNVGGAPCPYVEAGYTIVYSVPAEERTTEYTINEAGEGIIGVKKFTLLGAVYLGSSNVATCEYSTEIAGKYSFAKPLQWSLTGSLQLVKGSAFFCFTSEALSGTLAVSSSGSAVEATH